MFHTKRVPAPWQAVVTRSGGGDYELAVHHDDGPWIQTDIGFIHAAREFERLATLREAKAAAETRLEDLNATE